MSIRIEKAMKAAAGFGKKSVLVTLNVRQRCDEASEFEQELFKRIVAQDEAAPALSQIYQVYLVKIDCAEFQHRQVASGEVVRVDVDDEAHELCFKKLSRSAMMPLNATSVYNSWRPKAV